MVRDDACRAGSDRDLVWSRPLAVAAVIGTGFGADPLRHRLAPTRAEPERRPTPPAFRGGNGVLRPVRRVLCRSLRGADRAWPGTRQTGA